MADFGAAQAAEQAFRRVGAGAVEAESDLVVDPLGIEPGMQGVPVGSFVGMDRRGAVDARPDEVDRGGFGLEKIIVRVRPPRSRNATTTTRRVPA
jgi:hypothetical protein